MSVCPNVRLKEWTALEKAVGKLEAFRDFMETNGEIRTPELVAAKIQARTTGGLYQLNQVSDTANVISRNVTETLLKALAEQFGSDYGWRIAEPDSTADWRGYVEQPNQANGNKPTVVINPAHVTLDTPLHEFGHIFLAMLKNNQRLYAGIITSVQKRPDFKVELARVNRDYRAQLERDGLTGDVLELALVEETIVELLGKMAAKQIDPDTGLYKVMSNIWQEILAIFKTMMGTSDMVDVLNIKPDATLEQLAHILAHKDLKFKPTNKEFKNTQAYLLAQVYPEYNSKLDIVNRLRAHSEDTDAFTKFTVDGTAFLITKQTAAFINNITAPSRSENNGTQTSKLAKLNKYLRNDFDKETEQLFKKVWNYTGNNVDAFVHELTNEYKQWFYALNGVYDEITYRKVIKRLTSIAKTKAVDLIPSDVRGIVTAINNDMFASDIFHILTPTNAKDIDGILHAMLTGTTPGLIRLFKEANIAFANEHHTWSADTVTEWLGYIQDGLETAQKRLDSIKDGRLLQETRANLQSSFDIEMVHPDTGVVEKDTITVYLSPILSGVTVSFKSAIWGYADPTFVRRLTLQTKIEPGTKKAQVALVSSVNTNEVGIGGLPVGKTYKQGVIIEDKGLNVIISSTDRMPQLPANTRELSDAEMDVAFEKFLTKHKASIQSFRLREANGQEIKIKKSEATPEQLAKHDANLRYSFVKIADGYYYEMPKSLLVLVSSQERQSKIMSKVIDTISSLLENQLFDFIDFTPSQGQSMFHESGEFRNGLYNAIAKRLYGEQYYKPDSASGNTKIMIPAGFRTGLLINRTLYQKVNNNQIEMPFNSETEGSLMTDAIKNDAKANTVDPVANDHVEAMHLAKQMGDMLDIEYQVITAEQAQALTAQAKNPWKAGDVSFYIGGVVYFVGDGLTMNNVFHEFSHPFVRHIKVTNPELFNKLYSQLENTDEGRTIIEAIKEDYKELTSDLFKEEVIVRALTASGLDKLNNLKTDSAFSKAINNILYAIKQAMRKVFGSKIGVSGLTAATTISELGDMLVKGDKITLDKSQISQADVVAYNKERKAFVDELVKVESGETQILINKFYDVAVNHLNKLMSNKNYDAIAELIANTDKGDIQEMKANLASYQTTIMDMAQNVVEDMEKVRNKSTALVNSLFRLDIVMEKILAHIVDIKTEGETQDNLHKSYYYDHLLKHWQGFIDEAKHSLDDQNVPAKSELRNLLTQIETNIRQSKLHINEMYANGARDVLYNELLPMHKNIKARYDETIAKLRKNGAPQTRIDKEYKRYHGVTEAEHKRLTQLDDMVKQNILLSTSEHNELTNLQKLANNGISLSPEKIEMILKGNMGDANFFNSYLEGYLYNTDPVIGGLASYVKNKLNEVMITCQAKYNDFSEDIQQTLLDAGFDPLRPGELGKKIGFEDTIAKREKDKSLTLRKVWTFLNPFKNYRFSQDDFHDKVQKAQVEFRRTGSAQAKQNMIDAVTAEQAFLHDYMHQTYVPEYYEREILFQKDQIGKDALYLRKEWGDRLRAITEPANTVAQQLAITDELDLMWREYRQMRSMYKMDGKPKIGNDLEVAKRIREHHEASLKFYESKPRKGVFQNALRAYEQELLDSGVEKDKRDALRQVWIDKNTVKVPKESWYDWRNKLYTRQSEILSKLPKSEKDVLDESRIMQEIFDLTGGFKDGEGQTKATEMSPRSRAKVKELEEELVVLRKSVASRNGLTKEQNNEFSAILNRRSSGQAQDGDSAKLAALYELKNKYGLTVFESRELNQIQQQLLGESKREATDYYVDIMNTWLDILNTSGMPVRQINRTADWLLDNSNINKLLGQNDDFDKWFKENHILKERFNVESKQMEPSWSRSVVWSLTIPTNQEHFETFDLVDDLGNVTETIQGKPILKYYSRTVKAQYKTEKIVGQTVDNKYQWLPKTIAQGAKDATYINQEYYDLEKNDPKLFAALEKLKMHHLKNQEGLAHKGRLYLDYPRYRKSALETYQDKNLLSIYAKRIKEFFQGAKDDAEQGFNDNDEMNLLRMDMFDNEITDVPIHGLYDVDSDDVSTNITHTMMQYMLSGERQKQLIKISPIVRAVQSVVGAESNKLNKTDSNGFEFVNKFNFFNRNIKTYAKQKGESVRKKAIDNFLEREFEGKRMTGPGSDVAWLNNTASLLFKRASFGFFSFNIPSALKNSFGAKFQGLIEAAAGQHMTMVTFQKGNVWSYGAMGELSFGGQLYKKGAMSLNQQIIQVFDPSQDRFEDHFGQGLSRTVASDIANFTWLYNFRKWVEQQATLQIFGGMMYHQKIEQVLADGTKTEIAYMDAWELKDNKIQLKEGINPKWGITYSKDGELLMGDEFSRYKNKVQQVMNNLQGAYAKFDQPEAQRYIGFRFLSYLRRYFTTMTMNRFGFSGRWGDPQPRINPGMGDVQIGTYITFIQMAKESITSLGKNLMYMTPEEKRASLRVITEVGSLIAINVGMALLFGWDPDDDDRFEKLRQKSGALPFPLVSEDPSRPFNGWGYLENHMLMLMMNVRAENEQFIPLPGYGLDDYTAMLDLKSIAFGPTVQTYEDILQDALDILQGDDAAYYARSAGPYKWQDEGDAKIWAHMARTFGLSGSVLDPAKGIKGFQSVQARGK